MIKAYESIRKVCRIFKTNGEVFCSCPDRFKRKYCAGTVLFKKLEAMGEIKNENTNEDLGIEKDKNYVNNVRKSMGKMSIGSNKVMSNVSR